MTLEQLLPNRMEASHTAMMENLTTNTVVETGEAIVELDSLDKSPLIDFCENNNLDEKNDSKPEYNDKTCQSKFFAPKDSKSRPPQLSLMKISEDEELETSIDVGRLAMVKEPISPTAEEVTKFINDKSAYIEDVFKCMLRGISNSKLSMVRGNAPLSITELEEGAEEESDVIVTSSSSSSSDVISPEVKIVKLIQNLEYFIDIVCSIKSSDAKDTYSIIVLYEKLIFDLKAEISSLSKSLKIYKTIVGGEKEKEEATR